MKLLIVCLLVAGTLAVPVKKSKQDIFKCEEQRNRFKEGVRYSYKYEGEVSSGIVGLSEDRTGLKLKCNVQVEVPESCELLLRTEGCVLEEMVRPEKYQKAPNSRQFSLAMSERPLYFRMTRGEWMKKRHAGELCRNAGLSLTAHETGSCQVEHDRFTNGPVLELFNFVNKTGLKKTRE